MRTCHIASAFLAVLLLFAGCKNALKEVWNGNTEYVLSHVRKGDKEDTTPLLIAASYRGHERIVVHLLSCGNNANDATANGVNALIAAAVGGHEDIVRLLIRSNANVNARDKGGKTALMCACMSYNDLLFEDIRKTLGIGKYPVNIEARNDVVRTLIASGADVNKADNDGMTALMYCFYGPRSNHGDEEVHRELIALLLNNGAHKWATNANGKRAYNVAIELGYYDVAETVK